MKVHRATEADIVAREFGNHCSKEQNLLIEDLLDAYDQNDKEQIIEVKKNKCLQLLDSEFTPTLSQLDLAPEMAEMGKRPRTRQRRNFPPDSPGTFQIEIVCS